MEKARAARNDALIIFFIVDDPPESSQLIGENLSIEAHLGKRVRKSERVKLWSH
jgi:hypothetical protein